MHIAPAPHVSRPDDCALLVVSCDAYADLWPPFFTLLRRYWPDCPFPVYLGTGEIALAPAGVIVLRSSAGKNWSGCMRDYLDTLPHPYVLMILDDFFLREPVSTAGIIDCLDFARRNAALQVRLVPRPKPTGRLPDHDNIGPCGAGTPYRLSTQAAIWDRRKLRSLLGENESIWEFEIYGNERANVLAEGFYSVRQPVLPYEGRLAHHVVEKGKWLPHEKWIFGRQEIGCDFSRRSTLSWSYTFFYHAVQATNGLLSSLPLAWGEWLKPRLKSAFGPLLGAHFSRLRGIPARPTERKGP